MASGMFDSKQQQQSSFLAPTARRETSVDRLFKGELPAELTRTQGTNSDVAPREKSTDVGASLPRAANFNFSLTSNFGAAMTRFQETTKAAHDVLVSDRALAQKLLGGSAYIAGKGAVSKERNLLEGSADTTKVVSFAQRTLGMEATGVPSSDFVDRVKAYQSENGLKADGIIGKLTFSKMMNDAGLGSEIAKLTPKPVARDAAASTREEAAKAGAPKRESTPLSSEQMTAMEERANHHVKLIHDVQRALGGPTKTLDRDTASHRDATHDGEDRSRISRDATRAVNVLLGELKKEGFLDASLELSGGNGPHVFSRYTENALRALNSKLGLGEEAAFTPETARRLMSRDHRVEQS